MWLCSAAINRYCTLYRFSFDTAWACFTLDFFSKSVSNFCFFPNLHSWRVCTLFFSSFSVAGGMESFVGIFHISFENVSESSAFWVLLHRLLRQSIFIHFLWEVNFRFHRVFRKFVYFFFCGCFVPRSIKHVWCSSFLFFSFFTSFYV